jgi:hypothetical protein
MVLGIDQGEESGPQLHLARRWEGIEVTTRAPAGRAREDVCRAAVLLGIGVID